MPRLQRTYLAPTAVLRNLTFPNGAPQQIQGKWRFLTINKESAQNVGDGEDIVTMNNRVRNRFLEAVAELGHLLVMAGGEKPSSSTRKRQDVIMMWQSGHLIRAKPSWRSPHLMLIRNYYNSQVPTINALSFILSRTGISGEIRTH
jgi:hypothetical protein